jgi:8-oxo-dGTP pyrophosphatase MutT (NUDIX family)
MEQRAAPTVLAASGRAYATFPAAVVAVIVNAREELLLLEHPRRKGLWEPVNGAVDGGETLLEAALREVKEEAGAGLQVRPLSVVHASTFAYDAHLQRVISVVYLMAHEGGNAQPGGDMSGSRVRWADLDAIGADGLRLLPPLDQPWLRERALQLFDRYRDAPAAPLQEPLSECGWNKHQLAEGDGETR